MGGTRARRVRPGVHSPYEMRRDTEHNHHSDAGQAVTHTIRMGGAGVDVALCRQRERGGGGTGVKTERRPWRWLTW